MNIARILKFGLFTTGSCSVTFRDDAGWQYELTLPAKVALNERKVVACMGYRTPTIDAFRERGSLEPAWDNKRESSWDQVRGLLDRLLPHVDDAGLGKQANLCQLVNMMFIASKDGMQVSCGPHEPEWVVMYRAAGGTAYGNDTDA